MEEDKFALAEKILKDVNNILSKTPELWEFDIVPVESNYQNRSPVLHLEKCLGLESWCVKHVFMYCYSELMDTYFTKPKREVLRVIAFSSKRLTMLLNVTLLLNPEISSFWNRRKEMVMKSLLDKQFELIFTRLVLSRKPKCNDAFSHRRWILEDILKDDHLENHVFENVMVEELRICELSADKCPNNYHSWNHRTWIMNQLKSINEQFDTIYFYIKEYNFSESWTSKHVSDFSCFHYRQFCIKNIFTFNNDSLKRLENEIDTNLRKTFVRVIATNLANDSNDFSMEASESDLISYSDEDLIHLLLTNNSQTFSYTINYTMLCRKLEILFHELVLNNELIRFYKHHETLWYHRRFIVHEILCCIDEFRSMVKQTLNKNNSRHFNMQDSTQKRAKKVDDGNSCILFYVLMSHEKFFVNERLSNTDNYAGRHGKYLKFVKHLTL